MSCLSPLVTAIRIRSISQIRLTLTTTTSHVTISLKSSARFQNRLTLSKNHALIMGSYNRPVSLLSHNNDNQFKTSKKMVTASVCRKSCPCCVTYCTAADKKSTGHKSDSRSTLDSKDSDYSEKSERKYNLTDVLLSGYEKRKLVLTGFYKSINDVPDRVSDAKMKRAGDLFRIYTNAGTAVVVLLTLLITINRAQKYHKGQLEKIEKQSR